MINKQTNKQIKVFRSSSEFSMALSFPFVTCRTDRDGSRQQMTWPRILAAFLRVPSLGKLLLLGAGPRPI